MRNSDNLAFSSTPQSEKQIATLMFPRAAEIWLRTREPYISAKTLHEYRLNIKTLSKFFGEMKPGEITAEQIRLYQRMRSDQCGPHSINHECSVLTQILKRIGCWNAIAPDYQPLPLPKGKRGRVLSDAEKLRLFNVAVSKPEWEAVFFFAQISINTTAGPKEVMTLRLKDVDLEDRALTVQPEGAKNVHRVRRIPLNDNAFEAVRMAIVRAQKLGARDPEHYLFPYRVAKGGKFDPKRHQTTFKTAWSKLRKAANLPSFRLYDLRHHAMTVLLENPDASEETVEAIAGHVSREMKKVYSHVRMNARRIAVAKMFNSTPVEGRLRNSDVVDLLGSGLAAEIVSAKIKASKCTFDTSVESLKRLRMSSVPDAVILAMVRAS
jgi:integrase